MSIFELDSVTYRYPDGTTGLDGVSCSFSAGERVALLGANGSGKSTLLKLLDGLAFAQSGTVRAFGEPLTEERLRTHGAGFRRRVAYVFQNADAQLFSPTVREELAFGPLQLELPDAVVEQRVEEIAALLGIGALMERSPARLSGGEKRKVALGCVLTINPEVILLDEPTSGLDPRSQRWLIDITAQLHRAGKTIITSTHDLSIASEIADRAIVLGEDHRVAAEGPVHAILHDFALLQGVNLIHTHAHRHGDITHSHAHYHDFEHEHEHSQEQTRPSHAEDAKDAKSS